MAISYGLGVPMVAGFFVYAIVMSYLNRRRTTTVEEFITARRRMSAWRISWAFYASAMGSWVVTSPPSYTPFAGVVGLVFYSISSGAPLLVIAYVGEYVVRALPNVLSLTDYAGWRYGLIGRLWVAAIMCLNMGFSLLSEYTTQGALYGHFLGTSPAIMIVIVGVLTMAYTSFGGLAVSIITDQVQGGTSAVLLIFIAIYLAIKFRFPLPHPMPCDPNDEMGFCISGTNATGWGAIFSMPASLTMSTICSEAFWQRVWAAQDARAVRIGAWFGFISVMLGVTVTGLGGWLAAWAGQIGPDTDGNLYLFAAFPGAIDENGRMRSWIGVIVLVCAIVMSMSLVDSVQNGLTACISSTFFKDRPLWVTRLIVVFCNVPVMVIATKGYTILELFLIANLICATTAVPLVMGLLPFLRRWFGGAGLIFSTLVAIMSTSVYGVSHNWNDDLSRSENISKGMRYAWMENNYSWQIFLICICSSIGAALLWSSWIFAIYCITGKRFAVPGFASHASHPELFPEPSAGASEADKDGALEGKPDEEDDEDSDAGKASPSDGVGGGIATLRRVVGAAEERIQKASTDPIPAAGAGVIVGNTKTFMYAVGNEPLPEQKPEHEPNDA